MCPTSSVREETISVRIVLLLAAGLVVAACAAAPGPATSTATGATPTIAGPTPTPAPTFTATVAPSPTSGGAVPSQPAIPAAAQPVVTLVRQALTSLANVPDAQVSTVSVAAVSWPDSSLGCPQPGMMYSQVVTPGYRVILQANGKTYEYHTDLGQRFVLCSKP